MIAVLVSSAAVPLHQGFPLLTRPAHPRWQELRLALSYGLRASVAEEVSSLHRFSYHSFSIDQEAQPSLGSWEHHRPRGVAYSLLIGPSALPVDGGTHPRR